MHCSSKKTAGWKSDKLMEMLHVELVWICNARWFWVWLVECMGCIPERALSKCLTLLAMKLLMILLWKVTSAPVVLLS